MLYGTDALTQAPDSTTVNSPEAQILHTDCGSAANYTGKQINYYQ